ncbi:MAG: lipopolysaccharide heptosyltransferase I [Vicinamibacterales bacterium]
MTYRESATSLPAPRRVLIVRLGAMGDIVHALPVLASVRATWPAATVDWLVEPRHRPLLEVVDGLGAAVEIDTRRVLGPGGWIASMARLRANHYDLVLDVQGLIKSAVLARATGAPTIVGFDRRHAREGLSSIGYTRCVDPGRAEHVVDWNLAVAEAAGCTQVRREFPLRVPEARPVVRDWLAHAPPFVLINPGAAWPNKRWPAERFGELASRVARDVGQTAYVLWGPGERALAEQVCVASGGAAEPTPETTLRDIVAVMSRARLVVSGDTGPFHIAAALGVPLVGIFGPTDPRRNGPVSPLDVSVSRRDQCECFHLRSCRAATWCLGGIPVDEVYEAVTERLRLAGSAA